MFSSFRGELGLVMGFLVFRMVGNQGAAVDSSCETPNRQRLPGSEHNSEVDGER